VLVGCTLRVHLQTFRLNVYCEHVVLFWLHSIVPVGCNILCLFLATCSASWLHLARQRGCKPILLFLLQPVLPVDCNIHCLLLATCSACFDCTSFVFCTWVARLVFYTICMLRFLLIATFGASWFHLARRAADISFERSLQTRSPVVVATCTACLLQHSLFVASNM
jgi:hypothetical protein